MNAIEKKNLSCAQDALKEVVKEARAHFKLLKIPFSTRKGSTSDSRVLLVTNKDDQASVTIHIIKYRAPWYITPGRGPRDVEYRLEVCFPYSSTDALDRKLRYSQRKCGTYNVARIVEWVVAKLRDRYLGFNVKRDREALRRASVKRYDGVLRDYGLRVDRFGTDIEWIDNKPLAPRPFEVHFSSLGIDDDVTLKIDLDSPARLRAALRALVQAGCVKEG